MNKTINALEIRDKLLVKDQNMTKAKKQITEEDNSTENEFADVTDSDLTGEADFDGLSAEPEGDEDECGPPTETDMVDSALRTIMLTLEHDGYSEDDAEEAVYDAIGQLVEAGEIEDTPDQDLSDDDKRKWISKSIPLVVSKLKEMGLEFEDEEEILGDEL